MANNDTVRILAFDPSSSEMGWALVILDTASGIHTVTKRGTIYGKKLFKERKEMAKTYDKRFCLLDVIYEKLCELMTLTKPDYVAAESPFMHSFAQTLIILTLVLNAIGRAAHAMVDKPVHTLAPKEIKKCIANANAGKQEVQQAVLDNPLIVIKESKQFPISVMTEHEFDAIACAYTFSRYRLPGMMIPTR